MALNPFLEVGTIFGLGCDVDLLEKEHFFKEVGIIAMNIDLRVKDQPYSFALDTGYNSVPMEVVLPTGLHMATADIVGLRYCLHLVLRLD